jgi:hypothetical protein
MSYCTVSSERRKKILVCNISMPVAPRPRCLQIRDEEEDRTKRGRTNAGLRGHNWGDEIEDPKTEEIGHFVLPHPLALMPSSIDAQIASTTPRSLHRPPPPTGPPGPPAWTFADFSSHLSISKLRTPRPHPLTSLGTASPLQPT